MGLAAPAGRGRPGRQRLHAGCATSSRRVGWGVRGHVAQWRPQTRGLFGCGGLELRPFPTHTCFRRPRNHSRDTEGLHDAGFETICVAALCATDPPLALSHLPLRRVPPTAINVHGHIHASEAPSTRHFNVSVERRDYAPVGLSWVLDIARRTGPAPPAKGKRSKRRARLAKCGTGRGRTSVADRKP